MTFHRLFEINYCRIVHMAVTVELEVDSKHPDIPAGRPDPSQLPEVFAGIPAKMIGEHVQHVEEMPWSDELADAYPIGDIYKIETEPAEVQRLLFAADPVETDT